MSTRFLRDRDKKKPKVKLSHYKYAIVMRLADRDLETIYRNEMPSKTKCRDNLHDVLKDLDTLKKAGLTHCDVKAKNCVRINNKIKMIDLDAASEAEAEGDIKDNAAVFVGEKFSSGAVPPEMIYQLHDREEVEKYKAYFCELEESDDERWKKVQPIASKTAAFVVKTFLTVTGHKMEGMDGKSYTPVVVKDMDKLPYDLIVANESVDLWSFGLMVYKFETGVNVFKIDDQKDDLEGFPEMKRLAYWNEKEKNDTLLKVEDPAARSLLTILLSPNPVKRGTIAEALNHRYFTLEPTKIEPLGESISENLPVVLGPNQFQINSHVIDLPENSGIDPTVATKVGELLLYAVRNGIGESQRAKGILIVVGSREDMDEIGYFNSDENKFNNCNDLDVRDWETKKDFVLSCFGQDGAMFINGKNGKIEADRFIIDLKTRKADQNGGTGHKNASAVGMEGHLAIKCSEDICLTDGKGKGEMKVFSGTKEPTNVPVKPPITK